jgi:hypothetical protein
LRHAVFTFFDAFLPKSPLTLEGASAVSTCTVRISIASSKDEKIDETAQAAASDNLVNAFDPNSVLARTATAGTPQV